MLARFVGGKLTERLYQQVVVDNRPGVNGIIAAEMTAKAPADGYTLMFMSTSHTMNAAIYKLPFDAATSFTPVMMLGAGPLVLVSNPSFAPAGVKDLIDLAKARPNTITYAVSGTGGVNHFAGALFSRSAGVQLINVPYKGGPQALTDLIGGQVQIMFATAAITLSQVPRGQIEGSRRQHVEAHCTAARNTDDCGIRPAGLRDEHLVGRARAGGATGGSEHQAASADLGDSCRARIREASRRRGRRAFEFKQRRVHAPADRRYSKMAARRARCRY